jgi:hypothetical protein
MPMAKAFHFGAYNWLRPCGASVRRPNTYLLWESLRTHRLPLAEQQALR